MNPEFSVIIVTYNSAEDINVCVNSIQKFSDGKRIEIIIVDNNSKDQSYAIANSFKNDSIRIIRNNRNIGFGAACNIAARTSLAPYLFFCNPDTVTLNNVFDNALRLLSDRTIGCVGTRLISESGGHSTFALKFPHTPFSLFRSFLRNIAKRSNTQILEIQPLDGESTLECDWVLGASMFIPRDIFFSVGGFDESFFLYFEDIDICKRIKEAGYRIIADRSSILVHKKHGSSKSLSSKQYIKIRTQSEYLYYKKHHGELSSLLTKYFDTNATLFRS